MLPQIDTIVRHLFKKDNLSDVSVEALREFVNDYPYSPAGRFLLTRKLRDSGAEGDIEEEAATAALYFSNPLWLQWALNGDSLGAVTEITSPVEAEEVAESPSPVTETVADEVNVGQPGVDTPIVEEELTADRLELEPTIEGVQEERHRRDEETADAPVEEMETVERIILAEKDESHELRIPPPVEAPVKEFTFEPYHTIDYFASQGIKLKPEDLERDKFGRQLRSFTEWLRTMKRIVPATIAAELDETEQNSIQQLAVHSVEGGGAETEAMAEVWVKQGNNRKAIDIYQKLSLQDPSKSHYFAAKIEALKA